MQGSIGSIEGKILPLGKQKFLVHQDDEFWTFYTWPCKYIRSAKRYIPEFEQIAKYFKLNISEQKMRTLPSGIVESTSTPENIWQQHKGIIGGGYCSLSANNCILTLQDSSEIPHITEPVFAALALNVKKAYNQKIPDLTIITFASEKKYNDSLHQLYKSPSLESKHG